MQAAGPERLAVYKTKGFARFARKTRIPDADLWEAACRVVAGNIDADLGGGVIKQRIARSGEGKSGGYRCIILFRWNRRLVYVYGFEKKDLGNVRTDELQAFRELADVVLGYTELEMARRLIDGNLIEIRPTKEFENA